MNRAPRYGGVLADRHVRAAVRSALRARGFDIAPTQVVAARREQRDLGRWLATDALPARVPAYLGGTPYAALEADAPLAERFPRMAALGYSQGRAVGRAVGVEDASADLALLGAAFNTAIALLDYLVDERSMGEEIFGVIDEALVRSLFADPATAARALAAAHVRAGGASVRALLVLMGTCRELAGALHDRGRCEMAWAELARAVSALFLAEQQAAFSAAASAELLPALERKSMGPTEVVYRAARLSLPRRRRDFCAPPPWVSSLGRVFLDVDDLVDVLRDDRRGEPNTLQLRLASDNARLSDADVYELIDTGAAELADTVAGIERLTESPDVAAFARTVVALWTGWEEDPSVTTAPAASQSPRGGGRVLGSHLEGALEVLLEHCRDGYRRAAHHLHFPRSDAAGVRHETHPAVLSFRAVGLDALLDARQAGLPVPEAVLHSEAYAILRAKHPLVRGGWNYIEQVPELPPDIDDLGQVLQVLARLGGPALASSGEEAARLAVDAMRPDGGVSTWILDPRGTSPADDAVRAYLPVMGGWGVHPEVVANFGYGLLLYDRARFAAPLARLCDYLIDVQDPEGSWTSKWYAGPFYGSYRAVTLLAGLGLGEAARTSARAFLLEHQCRDGSWGDAEPLSSALALLALAAVDRGPDVDDAVDAGRAFLAGSQQPDGSWPAAPWISFPTLDGPVVYGSEAMTTAFALKALLCPALTPAPDAAARLGVR